MLDFVRRSQLTLPLAVFVMIAAPLVWRLTSFPPAYVLQEPLIAEVPTLMSRAVDLPPTRILAGAHILQLPLRPHNVRDFASASEVQLAVATHLTQPQLLQAAMRIEGTTCRFATTPGTTIVNNTLVRFLRQGPCDRFDGVPSGDVTLEIWIEKDSGRIAVWTYELPAGEPSTLSTTVGTTRYALRGALLTTPPPTRTRLGLLAYLWNVTPNVLWARLRGHAIAVAVGLGLLFWRFGEGTSRRMRIAAAALGVTLLGGGLAATHALLFPPLQTPDEPDHLLSLALLQTDPQLARDTETLARRSHFNRIRHRGDQHFREVDIGRPWHETWPDDIHAEPMHGRSPLTAWWWQATDPGQQVALTQRLWSLRRANAWLFGVSCGLSLAFLATYLAGAAPHALAVALLAVPTLPFFGSSFADTAVIVSVSLLLASCVTALMMGPRNVWLGAALGTSMTLTIVSGRRMWPLLPLAGLILVGHALAARNDQPLRNRLWFWGALSAVLAIGVWTAQRAGMFEYAEGHLAVRVPAVFRPVLPGVIGRLWMIAPFVMLLAALELARARVRWPAFPARRVATAMIVIISAWLVGGLLSSVLVAYPTSAPGVDLRAGIWAYTTQVLAAMAVPFRLSHHDLMLSLLFWGGMGWVDTSPPVWMVNLLVAGTTTALVITLVRATRNQGQVLLFVMLAAGLVVSLAIYAAGSFVLQYALYGRYLVGWYLLIVVPAWTVAAFVPRYARALLVLLLAVHAFYLQLVPLRYF